MLKRLLLGIVVLVIILPNVLATIGVVPPSHRVDFEPGLKKEFTFEFLADPGMKLEVVVEGDFSQYVKLDRDFLQGGGVVKATLSLPRKADIPGIHTIFITARQLDPQKQGFALIGTIKGQIHVKVPYPEQYAVMRLEATNANAGEPVNFTLDITSLGEVDITTAPYIEVFDSKEKVESLYFEPVTIERNKAVQLQKELDTKNYKPGDYRAVATAEYGKSSVTSEAIFRLGELRVDIVSHSNDLARERINRFDINVESFWKDTINEAYVDAEVLDYPIKFTTPTYNLEGFKASTMTGYFDTTGIQEDKFKMRIALHYANKTTEKIVDVRFKREIDYLTYGLIAAVALLTVALVSIVVWMRGRRKK